MNSKNTGDKIMGEDIKSLSDLDVVSAEDTAAVEIAVPRVAVH